MMVSFQNKQQHQRYKSINLSKNKNLPP